MTSASVVHSTESPHDPDDPALEVIDRLRITDLVHRLAAALDERRFADLGDLFTDGGSVNTPGGIAEGRPAVIDQVERNHRDYARTQHRVTNILVTLDGERATVRADMVARLVREGDVPSVVLGAVYRWQVCRTPQGWRFAGLEISPVWRVDSA
jgi:SnoaL-like domain